MFQPVGQVPAHRPGGRQRPLSRNFRPSGAGPRHSWRRFPGCLAQVRKKVGDLRRWKAWAIDWRSRTLREKQTCSAWPGDLRWKKGGPAPEEGGPALEEGGPAPEEGRTCSARPGDLRRKRGGPAPQPWPVGLAGGSGGGVRNSGTPQSKMRGFRWRCPGFGDTSYTSSVMSSSQVASVSSKVPGNVLSMSSTAVMLPLPLPLPLLHPAL